MVESKRRRGEIEERSATGAAAGASSSCSDPSASAASASKSWDGEVTDLEQRNYFWSYDQLYCQKEMLEDAVRMEAYHKAIKGANAINFDGKVVLDVGSGTGVLALFAAQAGARKVYAVEASEAAKLAKRVVAENCLENVVTVVQGTIEQVDLPEQVDVIISEFMGHFLLRESMIDSVLYARDKFLKRGGAIYPSRARMYLAPAFCEGMELNGTSYSEEMQKWGHFLAGMRESYGLDFDCLSTDFEKEMQQELHGINQGVELEPHHLLGPAVCVKEIDLLKASMDDVKRVSQSFTMDISPENLDLKDLSLSAFAGWFSVHFDGSPYNPTLVEVECSNEPSLGLDTHWGQEAFVLNPPIAVRRGDKVEGHFEMTRMAGNWRLYDVNIDYSICSADGQKGPQHFRRYHMD